MYVSYIVCTVYDKSLFAVLKGKKAKENICYSAPK